MVVDEGILVQRQRGWEGGLAEVDGGTTVVACANPGTVYGIWRGI